MRLPRDRKLAGVGPRARSSPPQAGHRDPATAVIAREAGIGLATPHYVFQDDLGTRGVQYELTLHALRTPSSHPSGPCTVWLYLDLAIPRCRRNLTHRPTALLCTGLESGGGHLVTVTARPAGRCRLHRRRPLRAHPPPGSAPHPATPGPHRWLPCRHRAYPHPPPDNTPKRSVRGGWGLVAYGQVDRMHREHVLDLVNDRSEELLSVVRISH